MKKIVTFLIAFIMLFLCSCKDNDDTPTYLGMEVVETLNEVQEETKEEIDSFLLPNIVKDISELATVNTSAYAIDIPKNALLTEYQSFTLKIKFDNPSEYTIKSLIINDFEYTEANFKAESDSSNIYIKMNGVIGLNSYEISDIKYYEDEEMKDVIVEGDNAIDVYVKHIEPYSSVSNIETNLNQIKLDVYITDSSNIIGVNDLKIFLSDGSSIVAQRDLKVGKNNVVFDNLIVGTTYQYAILTVYDCGDGKGVNAHTLAKDYISTVSGIVYSGLTINETSIAFDLYKNDSSAEIISISLHDKQNNYNEIKNISDFSEIAFYDLTRNHEYGLKLTYKCLVNNKEMEISDTYILTTETPRAPEFTIDSFIITDNSIKSKYNIFEQDYLDYVTKIELIKNHQIIDSSTSSEIAFMNLQSNTQYQLKIYYSYNLNDGKGTIDNYSTIVFYTNPSIDVTSFNLLYSTNKKIYAQVLINNLSEAEITAAVINGRKYNVSATTTSNEILLEIDNDGRFKVGEVSLELEAIYATLDDVNYVVDIIENNTVFGIVTEEIEVESISIINSSQEQCDWGFLSDSSSLLIDLNDASNCELTEATIIINEGVYTSEETIVNNLFTKLSDDRFCFDIAFEAGFNTIKLLSLKYNIGSLTYELPVSKVIEYYKLASDNKEYIETYEDLLNMNQNCYYELKNDIDLINHYWTAPGDFNGVFNGNGFSIKNMRIYGDYAGAYNFGLFKTGTGVIKNLKMEGFNVFVTVSQDVYEYVYKYGSLVADADELIVDNCSLERSSINIKDSYIGDTIGGLIGEYDYLVIKNSYNTANISAKENVGGIVGKGHYEEMLKMSNCYNSGTIKGEYSVGGLAGDVAEIQFDNCYNTGNVESISQTGGLVGHVWINTASSYISNCYNTGIITAMSSTAGLIGYLNGTLSLYNCYNTTNIKGDSKVGGIIGDAFSSNLELFDCSNEGAISGIDYIGGLVGTLRNDYTYMKDCYNSGKISASDYYAGGLIGNNQADKAIISRCFNTENIYAKNDTGGLIGSTDYIVSIDNSYNIGLVSGNTSIGGLVGFVNDYISIRDCYNGNDVNGGRNVGGLIGYTDSSFDIDGCFSIGKVTGQPSGSLLGAVFITNSGTPKVTKSYYSEGMDAYSTLASKKKFYSTYFYKNILKWDEFIWNFDYISEDNNKLPTLI